MSTTAHEKNARAYLFVKEGALVNAPPFPLPSGVGAVLQVRDGFPFPRVIGGIVFAVEESLVDPPEDVDIVYIRRGHGFPVYLPHDAEAPRG